MKNSVLPLNKSIILTLLLIVFFAIFRIGFSQTIESVKEKIKNNDLESAEVEVTEILKKEKNNIEALELLNRIKKLKKQEKSEVLTKKALIAIDNEDFEVAYDLLEEALVLDPDNKKARDLFLSLNEVVKVEKESKREEQELESQRVTQKEKKKGVTIAKANVEGAESNEASKKGEAANQAVTRIKAKEKVIPEFTNWFEAEVFPLYSLTNSNRLSYFDSSQSLIGSRLEFSYYPVFTDKRGGVSFEYLSLFLKTSGSEYIKFNVHRFNFYIKYRTYLLTDNKSNKLLIEPKLGYMYFLLNNLMEYGAYEFKKLYGPVFGINLADPLFYRFIDKDFLKKLGIKVSFNLFYIPIKGAPISPEIYFGPYYKIGSFNINAGFRLYMILKGNIKETYSDIEAGVSYFM